MRLDLWLWYIRAFKTRGMAQRAIAEGAVRVDGKGSLKAAQPVRPGDRVVFPIGRRWRCVTVLAVGARRGPAAEARALYREEAAPPTDEFGEPAL